MNKICVAMIVNDLNNNGISNVVMNYCLHMNKDLCKMTIIAGKPINDFFRIQCKESGIELVEMPERKVNTGKYYKTLWKELSGGKYDIVHIHGNSATISVELLIAKLNGIKVRIAHCHNSTCSNVKAHKILLPLFNRLYTHGFACSSLAGDWLFGNKEYDILPNGFITEKFFFDLEKRNKIRNELDLNDKFVIGTVARFNDQKNHPYLLKIFEAVAREKEDAYLVLVGGGPNLEMVKKLIEIHPYKDRIIYYGETNHVECLYDAFDVFVLPTKFEGLGIVFIEAQISGLPVITSNKVPPEVNIGNRTKFIALSEDIKEWKDAILNSEIIDRDDFAKTYKKEISVYDIRENVKVLLNYYLKFESCH